MTKVTTAREILSDQNRRLQYNSILITGEMRQQQNVHADENADNLGDGDDEQPPFPMNPNQHDHDQQPNWWNSKVRLAHLHHN